MTDGLWLGDEDGDRLDLSDIEPYRYHVGDMPVTRVEYRFNSVTIEWASKEQVERWNTYSIDEL